MMGMNGKRGRYIGRIGRYTNSTDKRKMKIGLLGIGPTQIISFYLLFLSLFLMLRVCVVVLLCAHKIFKKLFWLVDRTRLLFFLPHYQWRISTSVPVLHFLLLFWMFGELEWVHKMNNIFPTKSVCLLTFWIVLPLFIDI